MVVIEDIIEKALLRDAKRALEDFVGEQYSDDLDAPYWDAVGDGIDCKICVGYDGSFWIERKSKGKKKKKKNKKIPWVRFDAFIAEPEELLDCIFSRLLELEEHAVA